MANTFFCTLRWTSAPVCQRIKSSQLRGATLWKNICFRESFQDQRGNKARRTELGRKLEISGYTDMEKPRHSLSLNGTDCSKPLPERLRAWVTAFKEKNTAAWAALDAEVRAELKALNKKQLSENGDQFLRENAEDWLFKLGVLQLMKPGERTGPQVRVGNSSEATRQAANVHESQVLLPGDIPLSSICLQLRSGCVVPHEFFSARIHLWFLGKIQRTLTAVQVFCFWHSR